MKMYYEGQKFGRELPGGLGEYCRLNGMVLHPFGLEGWTLVESSNTKFNNLKANGEQLLREALQESDWRSLREHDRLAEDAGYQMDRNVFAYRRYLRDFDSQPGEWWEEDIMDFEKFIGKQGENNHDND
jgi:hypothetical protein